MEYRVTGKYGFTYIRIEDNKAKVEAVVRGKNYRIETDDVEYAIQQFSHLIGMVGADLEPNMLLVEVTKNGKVVAHFCRTFQYNGRERVVPFKTVTPHGTEEDTYIATKGVVKRYFIRLSQ